MAAANEAECYRRIRIHEGGNDDDPRDPGGRTSRGVTQGNWNVYRQTHAGLPTDVWQAPESAVGDYYHINYWAKQRCGELPAGVDYAIYDYGINSGPGRSGKVLRRVLGLSDTASAITDDVLRELAKRDPKDVINAICDERMRFLQGLSTWATFGRGWSKRVLEVRVFALQLAKGIYSGHAPIDPAPKKGVVPPSSLPDRVVLGGGVSGGGLVFTAWQWVLINPVKSALLVFAAVVAVGALIGYLRQRHADKQEAATPDVDVVPVRT